MPTPQNRMYRAGSRMPTAISFRVSIAQAHTAQSVMARKAIMGWLSEPSLGKSK
jgi:hypothetical protein